VLSLLGDLASHHRWKGESPGWLPRLASSLLLAGFLVLLPAHMVLTGLQTGRWGMLHEWHVPQAVVSEAMGHAYISFTFRIHGHLVGSAQADVMRRLNAEQAPPKEGREAG
jgi:hypothetical protein